MNILQNLIRIIITIAVSMLYFFAVALDKLSFIVNPIIHFFGKTILNCSGEDMLCGVGIVVVIYVVPIIFFWFFFGWLVERIINNKTSP